MWTILINIKISGERLQQQHKSDHITKGTQSSTDQSKETDPKCVHVFTHEFNR